MKKKLFISFLALGMTGAFAATNTFKVNLLQDSIVDGKTVKAGKYKIAVDNGNAVFQQGKESVKVPAREETEPKKYATTELTYENHSILQQIGVGGTHAKIVFAGAAPTGSGM